MRRSSRGDALTRGLRALVFACAVLLLPVGLSAAQQPALPAADVDVLNEPQPAVCDGRAVAECLPDLPGVAVAPTKRRDEAPAADGESAPKRSQPARAGGRETARPRARAAAPGSVTIKDFSFQPATITVNVGDTVTWTNEDSAPHSATADDGSFDTGVFGKGQSRSHTFTKAGEFSYYCAPHPNMKATVKVVAADSGGGSEPQPEAETRRLRHRWRIGQRSGFGQRGRAGRLGRERRQCDADHGRPGE